MRKKMLVFDMDGTIADLYAVDGWLESLRGYDESPYREATPMVDMKLLHEILIEFKKVGYSIAVTSWLSKDSTTEYDRMVREAKKEWLRKYDFPFDEIHLVKYGTRKTRCTKNKADYQILIDDNANVRKSWNLGATLDANEDFMEKLIEIWLREVE